MDNNYNNNETGNNLQQPVFNNQPQNNFQPFDIDVNSSEKNKDSSKSQIIIIAALILGLIVCLSYISVNYYNKKKNAENNNSDKDNNKVVENIKKYNAVEKLKLDYESGALSINDYFTQLVYLEFSSLKLDSKYVSDYEYYSTECELDTKELLENYYDQLDSNIVKLYLTNKSMANVVLGEEKENMAQQSNNENTKYKVKVLENADLINNYQYTLSVKKSKYEKNNNYVTSFKNYNIEIVMNTKISGIEVNSYSKGIVDELHQKEYLNFDTTTMGIKLSNKVYYDFNTGYTYMTQPYGGDVWWKQKGTSQMVDLNRILNKLITMENVTKIDDNHFKIKMVKDEIEGLMNSAKSNTAAIKGDVFVDVYTEKGYIVKLEYDFSKIANGFDLFTTTINFSNYDNAGDVEIPEAIINNAKNM